MRKEGDNGAAFYRIPGRVTKTGGTLIASFDVRWGGGYGPPGGMDIAIMRSTDGAITWIHMQIIMDYDKYAPASRGNGVGDQTTFVDPANGRIWCAAWWSFGNNGWNGSGTGLTAEVTGLLLLNYTDDGGLAWSDPVSITPELKAPTPTLKAPLLR